MHHSDRIAGPDVGLRLLLPSVVGREILVQLAVGLLQILTLTINNNTNSVYYTSSRAGWPLLCVGRFTQLCWQRSNNNWWVHGTQDCHNNVTQYCDQTDRSKVTKTELMMGAGCVTETRMTDGHFHELSMLMSSVWTVWPSSLHTTLLSRNLSENCQLHPGLSGSRHWHHTQAGAVQWPRALLRSEHEHIKIGLANASSWPG